MIALTPTRRCDRYARAELYQVAFEGDGREREIDGSRVPGAELCVFRA